MLVKPMFFHRPSMTSTYDTSESIATSPPESDLDDEQVRNMMASPLYLQERELSVKFISLPRKCRETCRSVLTHAVFSHKRKSSQDTFSDRESRSSGHQSVRGEDETPSRFSDPENAARLSLEEQRDHALAEAFCVHSPSQCLHCVHAIRNPTIQHALTDFFKKKKNSFTAHHVARNATTMTSIAKWNLAMM